MQIKGAAYIVDLSRAEALAKEEGALQGAQSQKSPASGRSADRVDLSSQGLELEKLKRDMAALPDVRLDRVALARQNLQNGRYPVEPGVLAQKMVESFATV